MRATPDGWQQLGLRISRASGLAHLILRICKKCKKARRSKERASQKSEIDFPMVPDEILAGDRR
jgi:hypothetical protein